MPKITPRPAAPSILSLDSETTGVDFSFGARPFFLTTCSDKGHVQFYEWEVDPLTRVPQIPEEDLVQIRTMVGPLSPPLVGQNIKFDVAALHSIGVDIGNWNQVNDTLMAGHLLNSAWPHDLTSMARQYLRDDRGKPVDIQPLEDRLHKCCLEARRMIQQARLRVARRDGGKSKVRKSDKEWEKDEHLATWQIAEKGREDMPSAKEKTWKYDTWLPRALAKYLKLPKGECEVVNLRTSPFDVRIDRTTKWGNPFVIGKDGTREEVIAKYRRWVTSRRDLIKSLPELDGKRLGCFCKPEDCHGDVLKELVGNLAHPWWTVLSDYANADSSVTVQLWMVMEELLKKRNLWEIYLERMRVVPVVVGMERDGITVSKSRLKKLKAEYSAESTVRGKACVSLAEGMGYSLELPKSGNNGSLAGFVWGEKVWRCPECENEVKKESELCPKCEKKGINNGLDFVHRPWLDLPIVGRTEKGNPSFDSDAMEIYLLTLPPGDGYDFIESLAGKRKCDTRITYLASYEKYGVPFGEDFLLLRPSLNPTGTSTLRFSSSNPNGQNVDKEGEECPHCEGAKCKRCNYTGLKFRSLKYVFGPAPGREWWAMDYENIELRIPGYESGERVMIELFEKANEPPYFGSYHLLNASIIYPEQFWPLADQKGEFKKRYASTYYQWVKNFGFAFSYGAQDATADRAAHKKGARRLIAENLKEHAKLNKKYVDMAARLGYVETIPDASIGAKRGYPIYCSRNNYERISPTIPLNFHVQSTAMWCTMKAMNRCALQLEQWSRQEGKVYRIALQVHDELVFDFPYSANRGNLPKVRKIKNLMKQSGDDIGVPLSVSISYHLENWSKGD